MIELILTTLYILIPSIMVGCILGMFHLKVDMVEIERNEWLRIREKYERLYCLYLIKEEPWLPEESVSYID